MTYIVRVDNQLKIIQVQPHQEPFFLADYAGRILAAGSTTMEALISFGQLSDLQELNEELNQAQSPH